MISQINFTTVLKAQQRPVGHTGSTVSDHITDDILLRYILIGQESIKAFGLGIIGSQLTDRLATDCKQAIEKQVASFRQSLVF